MGQETDVRFAYSSLLYPKRIDVPFLWGNQAILSWAREAGYTSSEFHCLRFATFQVLSSQLPASEAISEGVRSGHVIFNPYATLPKIILRAPDPLRPGERIATYNLALAGSSSSQRALHKLESVSQSRFPVVTYNYEVDGNKPFGYYPDTLLQTHPSVFNDESDAQALVQKVIQEQLYGVVVDTYHMFEATNRNHRPLADWGATMDKFKTAGVLKEVHVQPGREVHNDPSIPSLQWLHDMLTGNFNSEIARIIRCAKDYDQNIPFVIEVSIQGLINSGIVSPNCYAERGFRQVQNAHKRLIDYIRRA